VMANAIRMRILKLMRIFYSLRGRSDGRMKSSGHSGALNGFGGQGQA
jgi:hypothetical protein